MPFIYAMRVDEMQLINVEISLDGLKSVLSNLIEKKSQNSHSKAMKSTHVKSWAYL